MSDTHTPAVSADDRIVLNGVDALSGSYLTPPLQPDDLVELAQLESGQISKTDREFNKRRSDFTSQPTLGFDAHLENLSEARWGVIFAAAENDRTKQALERLIKHRADFLGFQPPVFEYQPGWTASDFLATYGVARGYGEVEKVPYYLLVAGNPSQVPFRFQHELDSEYAVGRLSFDSSDGYAAYIERLIEYETASAVPTSRDVVFWAPANRGDRSTLLSSELLVRPLYDGLNPARGFNKQLFLGNEASKSNLEHTFAGSKPPTLVFTASHGLGFSKPDPQQAPLQGALVTQEWVPGTPITANQIFSGADMSSTNLTAHGLIHFAFACYGAGTPAQDDYAHGRSKVSLAIADHPFVADLPRQLLTRGALALIGHVDRAWGYSFIGAANKSQTKGFERAINSLLSGVPIAHALRDLHDRGAHLSSSLLEDLNDIDNGKIIPALTIAELWNERNDARAYILIGDPAARLRVNDIR